MPLAFMVVLNQLVLREAPTIHDSCVQNSVLAAHMVFWNVNSDVIIQTPRENVV
jgi:hypothetical protein